MTHKDPIAELFLDGKCFLFPSFFRTMLSLRKAKRDFAIIFRTFGADTLNVITEYNRFCDGTHPAYNGKNNNPLAKFDGTKGNKNYILSPDRIGLIHRHVNMNEMAIVLGTTKKQHPGISQTLEDAYSKELAEDRIKLTRGFTNVYSKWLDLTQTNGSLAFVDDYDYWKKNDEKQHAAKIVIVDPNDPNVLPIFFDETINL